MSTKLAGKMHSEVKYFIYDALYYSGSFKMILHYKFRSLSSSCRKLMRYLDQMLEEKRRLGTLMVILDVYMLAQRCTTSMFHEILTHTSHTGLHPQAAEVVISGREIMAPIQHAISGQ